MWFKLSLTVGVATDEDSDAAAARNVVRRQGVDVAADGRLAQRRLPRAGLPAPYSRRPHGGRLPAWLHTQIHTHTHAQKGHLVSVARGAHAGRRGACLRAKISLIHTQMNAVRQLWQRRDYNCF